MKICSALASRILKTTASSFLLTLIATGCGGGGSSISGAGTRPVNNVVYSVGQSTIIADENKKTGASDWDLTVAASNHQLEGFASATSINRGESIKLYVNTTFSQYTMDVYRMGWYQGLGARRVLPTITRTGTVQTLTQPDPVTGLAEQNWADPYTLQTTNDPDPTVWCSGVYLVKLTAGGFQNYIIFVVRDDARHTNVLMQTADTTYQAYNNYLGKSLYANRNPDGIAARMVSYNRPYAAGAGTGQFMSYEYQMVRFLEKEGYDVSYSSNIDTHERGQLLLNHEAWMNVGHDEYWTWQMRDAVEAARNAGTNIAFMSADNAYWQIRLQPSAIDGAPDRNIVGYKEAAAQDPYALDSDPTNDIYVTGSFAAVGRTEETLVGLKYLGQISAPANMVVSDTNNFLYTNTGLAPGAVIPGTVYGELDKATPSSPAGMTLLAHTPIVTSTGLNDVTDMAYWSSQNGAVTFAAGQFAFSWGLDDYYIKTGARNAVANPNSQQMMRNLMARLRIRKFVLY